MKKTLSITVQNEPGVLTRISTVFSSRGFNIDSIAVGPTEQNGISKIIMILPGDNQTIEQITTSPCVERELMLVKVSSSPTVRSEIVNIVDIFRAKIVDIADFSTTIEVTGDPGKITTILNILKPYQIIEIVRTGKISVERELGINSELLRSI